MIGNKILVNIMGDEKHLTILDRVLCGGSHINQFVHGEEFLGAVSITKYLCADDEQRIYLIEPSEIEAIIPHKH